MTLRVQLTPPLNNTAGRDFLEIPLQGEETIETLLNQLIERFGPAFRQHLYDDKDLFIPSWVLFINKEPVQLNRPEAFTTPLKDGDEISFLLALAGG
ncbi:MAG: MoaD/ThiS family protein [Deltaproteobacteria bacterium]|nr:MoaD/ThiS family protein [Deltaproteobacteria bacterium]